MADMLMRLGLRQWGSKQKLCLKLPDQVYIRHYLPFTLLVFPQADTHVGCVPGPCGLGQYIRGRQSDKNQQQGYQNPEPLNDIVEQSHLLTLDCL